MAVLRSRLKTRCSLVIKLIDAYNGEPPGGSAAEVVLEDVDIRPIRKPEATYVFTDLTLDTFTVSVNSYYYSAQKIAVQLTQLDPGNPVIYISMLPKVNYPFTDGSTRLHGAVVDNGRRALEGAFVTATMLTEDAAAARLAQDKLLPGETAIALASVTAKLAIGDRFWIKDRSHSRMEICRIADIRIRERGVTLERPIEHDYQRGALILPVITAVTNEKGEFVVPYRSAGSNPFLVRLHIQHEAGSTESEVSAAPGALNQLGVLQL